MESAVPTWHIYHQGNWNVIQGIVQFANRAAESKLTAEEKMFFCHCENWDVNDCNGSYISLGSCQNNTFRWTFSANELFNHCSDYLRLLIVHLFFWGLILPTFILCRVCLKGFELEGGCTVGTWNVKLNAKWVCHTAKKMRWCIVSEPERRKCAVLAKALGAIFPPTAILYNQLSCVKAISTADCLSKIRVSYYHLPEILM